MSQELHYTSAPRGLTPGTRGFCTVARTADLSNLLAERLESLSGYRQVFPPHHPSEALNPLVYSHLRMGNTDQSILSRIGFAGLDYSDRANKYAHHLVLSASERAKGGPAWLISQPGVMDSQWVGEPRILSAGRVVAKEDQPSGICWAWQQVAGDSGWAGALAQGFLNHPDRPSYLVYEPGVNLLPLFVEALALVPPERRWQVTFSTYYTGVQPGISCLWRGVLANTPEAEQALRMPGALVIDLTHACGVAPASPLAHQARTGEVQAAVEEEEFEEPIVPEIDFAEPLSHGYRDSYQLGTPPPLEHASAPGLGKRGNRPPRLPGQRITADSTRTPGQTRILVGALLLLVLGAAGGLSFWFIRDRLRQASKAGSEVVSVNGKANQDELDDQAKTAVRPIEKKPSLEPKSVANQAISGGMPSVPGGDAQDENTASTEPKKLAKGESHEGNAEKGPEGKPPESPVAAMAGEGVGPPTREDQASTNKNGKVTVSKEAESEAAQLVEPPKDNVAEATKSSVENTAHGASESLKNIITPIYIKSFLATAKDNEALIAEIGMSRFTNIELLGWSHSPEAGMPLVEPKRTGLKVDARFRLNSVDEFLGSFEIKDQALVWNADVIGKRLDKDASGKALRNLANCLLRIEKESGDPAFVLLRAPLARRSNFDKMLIDNSEGLPFYKKTSQPWNGIAMEPDVIGAYIHYFDLEGSWAKAKANLKIGHFCIYEIDQEGAKGAIALQEKLLPDRITVPKPDGYSTPSVEAGIIRTDYDIQFTVCYRSTSWKELLTECLGDPRLRSLSTNKTYLQDERITAQYLLGEYVKRGPVIEDFPSVSISDWEKTLKLVEEKNYKSRLPIAQRALKDIIWVNSHSINFCLVKEFIDDEGKSVFIRVDEPTPAKEKNK